MIQLAALALASLKLPDRLRTSLIVLAEATDDAAQELYERLSAIDPVLDSHGIPDRVSEALAKWDKKEGRWVVFGLVALGAFRAEGTKSFEQLIDDVIESLSEPSDESPDGPTLAQDKAPTLRNRLSRLLSLQTVSISAKALGVLTDHQRAFLSARILSDIRSVFGDDVNAGPAAAVIVHSLKIEFTGNGGRKQFFVAMDSSDLALLASVVKRAQDKDVALKRTIAVTQVPVLEPKARK